MRTIDGLHLHFCRVSRLVQGCPAVRGNLPSEFAGLLRPTRGLRVRSSPLLYLLPITLPVKFPFFLEP